LTGGDTLLIKSAKSELAGLLKATIAKELKKAGVNGDLVEDEFRAGWRFPMREKRGHGT